MLCEFRRHDSAINAVYPGALLPELCQRWFKKFKSGDFNSFRRCKIWCNICFYFRIILVLQNDEDRMFVRQMGKDYVNGATMEITSQINPLTTVGAYWRPDQISPVSPVLKFYIIKFDY